MSSTDKWRNGEGKQVLRRKRKLSVFTSNREYIKCE